MNAFEGGIGHTKSMRSMWTREKRAVGMAMRKCGIEICSADFVDMYGSIGVHLGRCWGRHIVW